MELDCLAIQRPRDCAHAGIPQYAKISRARLTVRTRVNHLTHSHITSFVTSRAAIVGGTEWRTKMGKHETSISINSFENRVRRGRKRACVVLAALAAIACIAGMARACRAHDATPAPQAVATKDTDAETYHWWRESMTRYQVASHDTLPEHLSDVPECVNEDGSNPRPNDPDEPGAYQPICRWDAYKRGNGKGDSYVLFHGDEVMPLNYR